MKYFNLKICTLHDTVFHRNMYIFLQLRGYNNVIFNNLLIKKLNETKLNLIEVHYVTFEIPYLKFDQITTEASLVFYMYLNIPT